LSAGTWRARDGGTEITVRLFEDPVVAWLSLVWLAVAVVVVTMFVASAASGAIESELSSVSVPAMLLLPGLGLAAQMYARWVARDESEIMRSLLTKLFEARSDLTADERIAVSQPVAA
jgi:hypothetical protein